MPDIVDKVLQNIDYGATVVTEKTRATYDEARVRISIEGLRGEREEALMAIGEYVLRMRENGEPLHMDLAALCDTVGDLDERIAFLSGKIEGIRQNADDNIKKKKESNAD